MSDLNDAIARVLRYGTVLSAALLAVGLALAVFFPPPGTPPSLEAMISSGFGVPALSPSALLSGVSRANPVSVLELGTLILLATPIARVAASVLLFFRERDSIYACVTLLVLAMLLFAVLVVGPAEA